MPLSVGHDDATEYARVDFMGEAVHQILRVDTTQTEPHIEVPTSQFEGA